MEIDMSLKLMYITNNVEVAKIAESVGVDRIFVDMEYIGKSERQGGMDTVQSHHTFEDIKNIRSVLTKSELLVRCNPIHDATDEYCSSKEEIDGIIECGADIIMLPYFKTVEEVKAFISYVGGRAKTMLLFETPEAVAVASRILVLKGIDEVFIGLNDLSLGYGKKFMFELLADGTVEKLCLKFKYYGHTYGFGGLASLDRGLLPGKMVLKEHYRLGSSSVILSRSFCNIAKIDDMNEIREIFVNGVANIRTLEDECRNQLAYFEDNKTRAKGIIESIANQTV
jgi:hypothetical protein